MKLRKFIFSLLAGAGATTAHIALMLAMLMIYAIVMSLLYAWLTEDPRALANAS